VRKFRFSLETVLKVKRQVEEQRQRELAMVQAMRDKTLMQLGATENKIRDLGVAQQAERSHKIDLSTEEWYLARHQGLRQALILLRRDLIVHEAALETARARAVEAARERRVLEKLEESQLAAWQQKANAEEQSFMDELAQRADRAMKLQAPSPAVR
jgi:flagellar FliJ protein